MGCHIDTETTCNLTSPLVRGIEVKTSKQVRESLKKLVRF